MTRKSISVRHLFMSVSQGHFASSYKIRQTFDTSFTFGKIQSSHTWKTKMTNENKYHKMCSLTKACERSQQWSCRTLINILLHYLHFQGAALSLTHMSAAGLIQSEVNTIYQTCFALSTSALIKAARIPKHLTTCYVYSYTAQLWCHSSN